MLVTCYSITAVVVPLNVVNADMRQTIPALYTAATGTTPHTATQFQAISTAESA